MDAMLKNYIPLMNVVYEKMNALFPKPIPLRVAPK